MDRDSPIPHSSRTAIASALIDLGAVASSTISRIARTIPADGTEAAGWLSADPGRGFEMMRSSLMAGTDHYHAFARLLHGEEIFVMSLAAVLRAFGEAMGRAWWLMDCDLPEVFARKAATLHLSEVREASSFQLGSRGADGKLVLLQNPLREAERQLSAVAAAQPGVKMRGLPPLEALFRTVSEACGVDGKGADYRALSAATHGSTLSIGGMSHVGPRNEDGSALVSLALSTGRADTYSWTAVRITEGTVRRVTEAFGARAELERLDAAVTRVNDRCRNVFTSLEEC